MLPEIFHGTSPSAVSRRSPSLPLASCVIPRRISLAQRLCAAVTTSDWPAHQALWMCPTVSRSSWASFQVGRSRRQISHLLDPRLPILHRKAPHGKEFVTTWMSRRRLWKGCRGCSATCVAPVDSVGAQQILWNALKQSFETVHSAWFDLHDPWSILEKATREAADLDDAATQALMTGRQPSSSASSSSVTSRGSAGTSSGSRSATSSSPNASWCKSCCRRRQRRWCSHAPRSCRCRETC